MNLLQEKRKDLTNIDLFIKQLNDSKKIVFFGGAGVSTASGIPDFRSQNGLYKKELGYSTSSEEILSIGFLNNNPKEFFDFSFNHLFFPYVKPSVAHKFPVYLEDNDRDVVVVTQNIDGLHQEAGSSNVIELHGTQNTATCMKCNKRYDGKEIFKLRDKDGIPRCTYDNGIVRHDVVLFSQNLNDNDIRNSIKAINQADMLIVAGTSLNVYPAAGLINYFIGKYIVVVNKESININEDNVLVFQEEAFREEVKRICSRLLRSSVIFTSFGS